MKRILVNLVTALSLAVMTATAQADRGTHDPGVNARQQHQQQRIKQGMKSGELTRHEARELRDEQRDIKQLEQAYKSDGKLTNAERKDLQHELNQQSRDIYQQKHDAQERFAGGTGVGNPGSSGIVKPKPRDPAVNARQSNQQQRIKQGIQSGELTKREAKVLREEQRDINQLESAYKSDGTLTHAERRDLQHELNEQSRDIYQQKHDAQTR